MKSVAENVSLVLCTLIVAAAIVACFYIGYHNNLESDRLCGQLIQSGNFKSVKECP